MRLSVIIPSFYPAVVYGGPIFTSFHTCAELAKLNVLVNVSTTNTNKTARLDIQPNIWQKQNNNFFVKYYDETIIDRFSLSLLLGLWKDIKKADVVHIQGLFSVSVPIGLIYAALLEKQVLLTPHGTLGQWCLSEGSRFKSMWLKYLITPFISKIVWHATAKMEKTDILTVFPNATIQIIPNGVQLIEFINYNTLNANLFTQRFSQKKSNTDKIIISMGRLQKVKGFDILINSFGEVACKYPNAKLFIAGPNEGEENNLRQLISKLAMEEKVFLIGQVSGQDKIDFIANADLFVLPSHNENFGIVYAESLAAGTPIIASKNTPWSEVEAADCGKWVNNDIAETANAMIDMLQRDRKTLRINSKKYAQKYDWKNIALQFKDVFESMVDIK